MDYMEGGTLRDYFNSRKLKLDIHEVRDLASQILTGVEVIHEKGFIHRDLKLDNILVSFMTDRGKPEIAIADFGFSIPNDKDEITLRERAGTPGYAAPEIYLR